MHHDISILKEQVFDKCSFRMTALVVEKESREYGACTFEIGEQKVVFRKAKITPTKTGQFVTLWKRSADGPIRSFHSNDGFELVVIATRKGDCFGQFVFPKSILLSKGIISNNLKEGKRAFRVYPPWDITTSNQAKKTQLWQLDYFLSMNQDKSLDLNRAKLLYSKS